jgi:hypothetical protein
MARPRTKQDLITQSNEQFEKMFGLINALSDEEQTATFTFNPEKQGKEAHWKRDKNIRDVLVHLYEWHELLLNWVASNMKGEEKTFLPEPYSWKTYGDMNVEFWKKHQNTSYADSIKRVQKSHKQVMDLIETFNDKELFSKGVFAWVGGSTLGQYCVSATVGHYDWAIKKIKAHIKEIK